MAFEVLLCLFCCCALPTDFHRFVSATIIIFFLSVRNSFRWRAAGRRGLFGAAWWFIGFVALNIGLFPANYFLGAFPPILGGSSGEVVLIIPKTRYLYVDEYYLTIKPFPTILGSYCSLDFLATILNSHVR